MARFAPVVILLTAIAQLWINHPKTFESNSRLLLMFSVFLLTQGQTGVTVKLEVFGSFVDLSYGDDGSLNDATGLYSTTLNQPQWNTIREVVDFINGGGTIDTGYTAEFTANAVPEPATLLTFGLGTAALAAHRRRRAKKSTKAEAPKAAKAASAASMPVFMALWLPLMRGTLTKPAEQPISAPPGNVSFGTDW